MNPKQSLMIAVSTSVLAAMAVSAPACPLDVELQVDDGSKTVSTLVRLGPSKRASTSKIAFKHPAPRVALEAGTPGAHAIVRGIAHSELSCGKGRGELVVRVALGRVTAQVTGFDATATSCLTRAIEGLQFPRIGVEMARLTIEL